MFPVLLLVKLVLWIRCPSCLPKEWVLVDELELEELHLPMVVVDETKVGMVPLSFGLTKLALLLEHHERKYAPASLDCCWRRVAAEDVGLLVVVLDLDLLVLVVVVVVVVAALLMVEE